MTAKTVTLALEWRNRSDEDKELYIARQCWGIVYPVYARMAPMWRAVGHDPIGFLRENHPTREAAMAALEAKVLAMGVKE